jgi:hypothetical protein
VAAIARGAVESAGSFVREKISSLEEELAERAKRVAASAALLIGGCLLCVAGLGAASAGLAVPRGSRRHAWLVASAYEAAGAALVVAGRIRTKRTTAS